MGEPDDVVSLVDDELRASVRRIEDRLTVGDQRDAQIAADVRALKQIVGLMPQTESMRPTVEKAHTYRLRTLVIASVATATGVLFDRVIALIARLLGG